MKNPIATISMDDNIRILIELIPQAAPNTVNSFIHLAQQGCFDNYAIQRIVPGYVVDISYSAFGQPQCKYLIANEGGHQAGTKGITVEPGVIGMGGYPQGIAGGEFFFPLAYHENIDNNYPAFGYVRQGWKEIESWASVEIRPVHLPCYPDMQVNEPLTPIIIREVRVETFGVEYPPPQRLEIAELPPSWL